MYNNSKTQVRDNTVVQHVGTPHFNYGTPKPPPKEVFIKATEIYKMTRTGKMHKISTLSGVVQVSGSCQYCMDWWDENDVETRIQVLEWAIRDALEQGD